MNLEYVNQYLDNFEPYKHNFWCYEDGILLKACMDLYIATKEAKYKDFVLNYLDKFINNNGEPKNYDIEEYSTDNVQPATVLFWAYDLEKKDKYLKAEDLFAKQLKNHPRCKCGNFFHKKRYPFQVWMDGLYMAQPFAINYGLHHNNDLAINDTIEQFKNVRKYLYDEEKKLYVHAYDENKVMQWADKNTGKAPNVWSRACGWTLMALIDIYELIKDTHKEEANYLIGLLKEELDGLIPHLSKDNMLYQVVDHPEDKNNYQETSGSAMMAYAMIKGYNLKVLDKKYLDLGLKMYEGINKNYLTTEKDGGIHLAGICQVAGLDNEKRNGSRDYYYSEKICTDEVKGVAPYFMLLSEIIKYEKVEK